MIEENSVADKCGKLKVGDIIVAINGSDAFMEHVEFMQLIKSNFIVEIKVARLQGNEFHTEILRLCKFLFTAS